MFWKLGRINAIEQNKKNITNPNYHFVVKQIHLNSFEPKEEYFDDYVLHLFHQLEHDFHLFL